MAGTPMVAMRRAERPPVAFRHSTSGGLQCETTARDLLQEGFEQRGWRAEPYPPALKNGRVCASANQRILRHGKVFHLFPVEMD